jgi:hypothetical protein
MTGEVQITAPYSVHKNHIRAKVRANRVTSAKDLGIKQGCPLSLLIFAIVADLYNMASIS